MPYCNRQKNKNRYNNITNIPDKFWEK